MANPGPSTRTQASFNSGEWSPLLHDRLDFDKFFAAARLQENNFVLPYGGFVRRAGTQYVSESKNNTKIFLAPFIFSSTTTYVIEFGNLYMRFYNNGAPVFSGSTVLEVVTPWTTAQLFQLQFVQDDDIMYLVHPDVPRQKLTRTSATAFSLDEVVDVTPPLLDENKTDDTLIVDVLTGSGEMISTLAQFNADHIDSYWQLRYQRDANYVQQSAVGSTSELTVEGDWRFEVHLGTSSSLEANIEQLSQDGSTWEVIRNILVDAQSPQDIIRIGTQETDKQMRVTIVSISAGSGHAYLENISSFSKGLVKVTAFTDATHVDVDVIETLFATTATPYWSEGAFSDVRGYPAAVCIYEERLWYGGSRFEPQTYYGSKIEDYEDFPVGTLDTDRVKKTLGGLTRNAIKWMVGQEDLLIGTSGEAFRISTGDNLQPLTPTVIPRQRSQTNYGSEDLQAQIVGDTVMFVQRGGRKLREFTYSFENNKYKSPDLTVLSEHMTLGGITQMAYQSDLFSILWGITGSGNLIGFAWERDQQLAGWFRYVIDGDYESVAVIPGPDGDEVWVSVNRTINSVTKRYIERINPNVWTDEEDAFYVDSGVTVSGSSTNSFSGLDHLIGETVSVLGDGADFGDHVVDESGEINTGIEFASIAQIGLPIVSRFKPMKFDIDNTRGNSQGQFKQISKVEVLCLRSMNFRIVDDDGKDIKVKWRNMVDKTNTAIPFFSGVATFELTSDVCADPSYTIVQDRPFPMTITSVTTRYEITEPI